MTLDEARDHIGDGVVYLSGTRRAKDGVITSVSRTTVLVRYAGGQRSESVRPADLTLLAMTPGEDQ